MVSIERDKKVDILRALALLGIIIAHINPPTILLQLRSFDVPLMALLMGTSFYLTNKDRKINYFSYINKRFKRLIIPTWQFLTMFFILFFIISLIRSEAFYFGIEQIIRSYILLDGIGYVWIIQVFVAVAFFNPLILEVSQKIKNNSIYILFLIAVYFVYLGLIQISNLLTGPIGVLFEHFVLYTIAYGLIAAIGIRIKQMSKKEILAIAIILLGVFIILMFVYDFKLTGTAKYPPTMYYISYALCVIFGLYLLLGLRRIFKLFDNKFIYFLSNDSMWIYLWHIIPIYLIELFGSSMPIINANFVTRFIFVFVIACLLTNIQNKLTKRIQKRKAKRIKVCSN
ncbi:acyltransferase family protein [Ammoniphilus resinae]|uniref:Surface polysaccharide O-acyltransferase-like enzyme n=1 Tax=Ammoniphilus resinae TaxID=861532 RepID=A0ABS4GY72_9BACL|nr:acyltransferase [Ammoniphilus resinae]MBP1934987.1 surface polysaccharide O-acyltransferase-like enzyme [Ammoniphilus resinae]